MTVILGLSYLELISNLSPKGKMSKSYHLLSPLIHRTNIGSLYFIEFIINFCYRNQLVIKVIRRTHYLHCY